VRLMFGVEASPARYTQAMDEIRFQLGQSDRFKAGLIRSGAWESHIADSLANLGLPPEISALPHVESSFDPTAYSKVGASGLWQFMRSTGRRFLRID
jgi:membrane-bound lytic murein transglycosylase D